MNRECNKCVYSTRDGGCRKWECKGTVTVEQIRTDVIEECKKLVEDDCTTYCTKGYKCVECLCEQMEQLKEQKE